MAMTGPGAPSHWPGRCGGPTLARGAIGVGASSWLMAERTGLRRPSSALAQMRGYACTQMAGLMGRMPSTLPVQWLLPHLGWRGRFGLTALLVAAATMLMAGNVAPDHRGQ